MKKNIELYLVLFSCFAIIASFYLLLQENLTSQQERVIFFDVGQGDAQLLQSGRVLILQDAGPNNKTADSLAKVLRGPVRELAVVLVTHPEADHIGGLPQVLRTFSVRAILIPKEFMHSTSAAWQESLGLASERNIPVVGVVRGSEVRAPGLQLQVLWPIAGCVAQNPTNECALVTKVRLGGVDYLFTGDIGIRAERMLLAISPSSQLSAQILKIPHHGSKNSILPQFFRVISPVFSVVQAGANNSYGHADPQILERLGAYTKYLWSTAQKGGVEVSALNGGKQLKIISWE